MPVAFMAFPGSNHLPIDVENLARSIISLGESNRRHGVINVHGDRPYTLWQLAKKLARADHRLLLPIPSPFTNKRLPKLLRSIDYTSFSATWRPRADESIVLPFHFEEGHK
jgi:hypothetical protein